MPRTRPGACSLRVAVSARCQRGLQQVLAAAATAWWHSTVWHRELAWLSASKRPGVLGRLEEVLDGVGGAAAGGRAGPAGC